MGRLQGNPSPGLSASSRLEPRICLAKGCGQVYQPRNCNQRYCQDPECLKKVGRWQAAKRQRKRRERPEVREREAAAECERRAHRREQRRRNALNQSGSSGAAHRDAGALSRKRRIPKTFCDRPGCYEPPRCCCNGQARYCGAECRRAMTRVRDRERKWLARKTEAGQYKRGLEYQARRDSRAAQREMAENDWRENSAQHRRDTVLRSQQSDQPRLPYRDSKEAIDDDRETCTDRGPRPPPSS